MPNGRPGDHPYTDIVTHDTDTPNKEVADIVREIDDADNDRAQEVAAKILWEAPAREISDEKLDQLKSELSSLAAEVKLSEDYSQESPLDACLADNNSVYTATIRLLVQDIHKEIEEDVENDWWVYRDLNAILWEFGWDSDQLDKLETRLRTFRDEIVREH